MDPSEIILIRLGYENKNQSILQWAKYVILFESQAGKRIHSKKYTMPNQQLRFIDLSLNFYRIVNKMLNTQLQNLEIKVG
jgi:hypothetical protein